MYLVNKVVCVIKTTTMCGQSKGKRKQKNWIYTVLCKHGTLRVYSQRTTTHEYFTINTVTKETQNCHPQPQDERTSCDATVRTQVTRRCTRKPLGWRPRNREWDVVTHKMVNTRGDRRHDRRYQLRVAVAVARITHNCRHNNLLVYSVHATVARTMQISANNREAENDVITYVHRLYTACKYDSIYVWWHGEAN